MVLVLMATWHNVARAGDINWGLTSYGGTWATKIGNIVADRVFSGERDGINNQGEREQWAERTWDSPKTITEIVIRLWDAASPQNILIKAEYWNGAAWVLVAKEWWMLNKIPKSYQCDVTAAKFRVTLTTDTPSWGLDEVELWGGPQASVDLMASAAAVTMTASLLTPPIAVYRGGTYIGSSDTSEYTDISYPPGQEVTYVVTDSLGKSVQGSVLTCPAPPVISASSGSSWVDLSWDPVATANNYTVARDGIILGTTSTPAFRDANLSPNYMFTYSVVAVNTSGAGRAGTVQVTTAEQPPPPQAPQHLRLLTRGAGSIAVAWDQVAGVQGYKLYVDGQLHSLTTSTTATIGGLSSGTEYTITVQAYTGSYDGAISAALVVSTIGVPAVVQGLTVIPGAATLGIRWQAPADGDPPTSYRIYLDGDLVGSSTSSSYTITGLAVDTTYTVGVAGVNEAGEGALATEVTSTSSLEPPAQITGLLVTTTVRTATLDWDPSPEADAYRVYLDGTEVAQVSYPAYAQTGLCPLTDYLIEVRAVNAAGIGDPASALVRTLSGKPTILKLTPSGSGYILTYHGPIGPDAPDEYMIYADDIWRTSAYIPTQWPDTDMGWTTGSTHEIRVDAIYGPVTASDTGTITAYVAVDPVAYPPPTELFEGVLQDWSQVILLVTALSIVWMAWDWWRGLMSRDPYHYDG